MGEAHATARIKTHPHHGLPPNLKRPCGTLPPTAQGCPQGTTPPHKLGRRTTALKEDIQSTAAELVYGQTLRLPGEFVCPAFEPPLESTMDYITQLKSTMQSLPPTSVRRHPQRATYLNRALENCTHVLVRHDAVKQPLQRPYDGPYKVLSRNDKFYTLEVNGKSNTVSLDRLKPAYLDPPSSSATTPTTPAPTPPTPLPTPPTQPAPTVAEPPPSHRTTRSGRHVHWPEKLCDYYVH